MTLKLRTAALFCSVAILSGVAAAYYFRVWPAPLLLPLLQTNFRRDRHDCSCRTASRPPVPVKVAPVLAEDVPIYLSGIGTMQAYNTVNVQSRIDGEIMQIAFQEGQDVKQGDMLAVIDPRPLQAQLEQQIAIGKKDQALLDGAILDMKRYDTLILKDFAIRQQVDQQHALVDQYRPRSVTTTRRSTMPATSSTTPRSARRSAAVSESARSTREISSGPAIAPLS